MSKKFQGKYRIESTRLKHWDYGWNASYFVTICTLNRENYFGDVKNNLVRLSPIGQIANIYWIEISNRFSFVELGAYIIMPNHVHGIITKQNR